MTEQKTMGPHMPLYLDRFLGGTMHFGADEIGAYILLIAHQWQYGQVENDQAMIERVARCEYGRLRRVLAKFDKTSEGHLVNSVCDKVRRDREDWIKQQSERGKKGMAARWGSKGNEGNSGGYNGGYSERNNHTDTDTDTIYLQPSSKEGEGAGAPHHNPPSLEKCIEMASMIGLTREQVEAFHAHYDSQGWRKGNGQPVTNIRSALQAWRIREQKFQAKDAITTGKVDTRKSRFS
jgi:uncharacterized protein YdaU (DUF1376 family)